MKIKELNNFSILCLKQTPSVVQDEQVLF